jgi:HJR/Mrr/RecB family endonuclease
MYEIDIMTGKEFEKLLSLGFDKLDYAVKLTSETQDYGADLILYKDNIKIVVQAKRRKNVIGVNAVQEVVSAIRYYQADKGMVVTNNFFTRNAYNLARSNEIELWDRKAN